MNTVRKYRGPLVLGMIVAVWGQVAALQFLGGDAAVAFRLATLPFLVAGFFALATYLTD